MAIQRTVKVTTTQEILKNEEKVQGFPMRKWSIQISLVGPNGEELPAKVFDKVTYQLHPTFEKPIRGMYIFLRYLYSFIFYLINVTNSLLIIIFIIV